ncbi:uncharacterized protein BDV17DRAFT_248129 [Aspergillus undulatus]|uniref:uncharacterized protein n=1 Tax=Aspergillus undulatus TaxID=1810928 RepID=UPI003CCE5005
MTPPTAMSTLATLPPELRLLIYEYSLSNGSTPNLMRTSRTIHNEIYPRLYDTLDIHIYPHRSDPWIRVSYRRLKGASWCLWEEADCSRARRRLHSLPYNRFGLTRVLIYAPEPGNLGQLAWLWLKVDSFVHYLLDQRTLKCTDLAIELRSYRSHTWTTSAERHLDAVRAKSLRSCKPTFSSPWTTPPLFPMPRWDSDFFWIPFGRLYKNPRQTRTLSDGSTHHLNSLIEDIQMYLATELENAKGAEARAIRLRVETYRILRYVNTGGPWPWARACDGKDMTVGVNEARTPYECLPRLVKELLRPGGGV